jgi:hypothetical protein
MRTRVVGRSSTSVRLLASGKVNLLLSNEGIIVVSETEDAPRLSEAPPII